GLRTLVASFPALRFRIALSHVVYNMICGFNVALGFTGRGHLRLCDYQIPNAGNFRVRKNAFG
ncbi:hypothetical protein KKF97_12810, partial [Myxococcota bacterium]|nr:hypothetical protein [Myxococcota bacterium]